MVTHEANVANRTHKYVITALVRIIAGVVTFGNAGYHQINFDDTYHTSEFARLLRAIRFPNENTNTAAGLNVMRQQLFGDVTSGVRAACWPKIAVVLTNGPSTLDRHRTVAGVCDEVSSQRQQRSLRASQALFN